MPKLLISIVSTVVQVEQSGPMDLARRRANASYQRSPTMPGAMPCIRGLGGPTNPWPTLVRKASSRTEPDVAAEHPGDRHSSRASRPRLTRWHGHQ
jgi:hypothetical protein